MIPAMIFLQSSVRDLRKLCKTMGALRLHDLLSCVSTTCCPIENQRISSHVRGENVVSVKPTGSIFINFSEK